PQGPGTCRGQERIEGLPDKGLPREPPEQGRCRVGVNDRLPVVDENIIREVVRKVPVQLLAIPELDIGPGHIEHQEGTRRDDIHEDSDDKEDRVYGVRAPKRVIPGGDDRMNGYRGPEEGRDKE